ncbi:LuxR C-terminal-related transcriptional regulator [Amycolatopsis nigrescens]|uniref:LuxR C-terminal-related transcriptional regulator n=1 Tax=Amycolatopsis nigrescens TaxID=381445 RepID=UPI00035FDAB2|nr:LuxR C-terminal-related transcriptional regulator [Amycolatopsis nigrescens]
MTRASGAIHSNIPALAAEAGTEGELGAVISRQVGRLVGHDGFQMIGLDPIARAGCLYAQQNCYTDQANQYLKVPQDFSGRRGTPFGRLVHGRPVELLGLGLPDPRDEPVREVMAAEGFGSELRIAFIQGGRPWGAMALLRERSSRPFSAENIADAERMCLPLATALRQFVVGKPMRPTRGGHGVGVLVLDQHLTVKAATHSARAWLRKLSPDQVAVNEVMSIRLVRSVAFATVRTGRPVINTVPTLDGWLSLQGELIDGARDVAITIQPPSGRVLLPATAAWHGITPREQAVVELILEGLPTKQIARHLGISPHTATDHLKAIYRKTSVNSREELVAALAQ